MTLTRDEAEEKLDDLIDAAYRIHDCQFNEQRDEQIALVEGLKQELLSTLATDTEKIEACHKEIISEIETDWTWNCPVAINKSEKLKTILTKHFGGKS